MHVLFCSRKDFLFEKDFFLHTKIFLFKQRVFFVRIFLITTKIFVNAKIVVKIYDCSRSLVNFTKNLTLHVGEDEVTASYFLKYYKSEMFFGFIFK